MTAIVPLSEAAPNPPPSAGREPGAVRQTVEALVCLGMAVVLFRAFQLEGYMISTGSMAPSLYGYHKRVVCPSCEYTFAFGVSFDPSAAGNVKGDDGGEGTGPATCVCPNCEQAGIDVSDVPRNQGDQLLVHKHAYALQEPRRWEVVVFRNPNDSAEAYVKRIVGLPGERIQVRDGDLHVDGRVAQKDLYTQRAIRIPVYLHDHRPTDDRWQPRWSPDENTGWQSWREDGRDGNGFVFSADERRDRVSDRDPLDWLRYRHRVRAGGSHETSVSLDGWPTDADLPDDSFLAVRFDAETNRLSCIGAMSERWRDRLLHASRDERFRSAVRDLYERSRVAPLTDRYGYNRLVAGVAPRPVRDLMFAARVESPGEAGRVVIRMTDGRSRFDWVLDFETETTWLAVDENHGDPVRFGDLPAALVGREALIEMSTFDRQVLLVVDGEPVFEPWPIPPSVDGDPADGTGIREPVAIGAAGASVRVSHLALYRDVHYTRGRGAHGVDEPYELGEDEFFALGDNSPVSFDSRSWPEAAIPRRLILGKPLVVHLPSKPGRIHIGDRVAYIRLPDFSRIRYVR